MLDCHYAMFRVINQDR